MIQCHYELVNHLVKVVVVVVVVVIMSSLFVCLYFCAHLSGDQLTSEVHAETFDFTHACNDVGTLTTGRVEIVEVETTAGFPGGGRSFRASRNWGTIP